MFKSIYTCTYIIYVFYYIYNIYISDPRTARSKRSCFFFLVWYVQRITKTLAYPGLLGASVQCMVLYWLLAEICWTCTGERIALPAYLFVCTCACEDVLLLFPVMYTPRHTDTDKHIRSRPCHAVSQWSDGVLLVSARSPDSAHPPPTLQLKHTLLQFEGRSFILLSWSLWCI